MHKTNGLLYFFFHARWSPVARFVSLCVVCTTLIQGLSYVDVDVILLSSTHPIPPIISVLLIWSCSEWIIALKSLHEEDQNDNKSNGGSLDHSQFFSQLPSYLKHLQDNENHRTIIRLRHAISRLLWVEGHLSERVTLGHATESAAVQIGDTATQIAALIDDIGWTLVPLKEYSKAESKIKHGLRQAENNDMPYWIAKAYRHLSGISTMKKDTSRATDYIKKATDAAKKITDSDKKIGMLAGIEYAQAIVSLLDGDIQDAMDYANKTDELRSQVGDDTRIIRTLALKGKIELEAGDVNAANDYFRKGLTEATSLGRRDEQIKNRKGLAEVARRERNFQAAEEHDRIVEEMSIQTPVPFEFENEALGILQNKE
ncbi:MAG: hypothetical protein ACNI27_14175 [Desulfovibrio sp.]